MSDASLLKRPSGDAPQTQSLREHELEPNPAN